MMVDISHIKKIAVIGAGIMGRGIAQLFLMAGFENVNLYDIKLEIIEDSIKKIADNLKKAEISNKLDEGITAKALLKKLSKETDIAITIKDSDFIVEAVPEIIEIKQEVFRQMGQYAPEHAILASNSSTLNISEISAFSGCFERSVGMHFNLPPLYSRLIEVIKGEKTSDYTFEIACSVGQKIPSLGGKIFVARIEKESPAHIFNRLNCASLIYTNWILDNAFDNNLISSCQNLDADVSELMAVPPFLTFDYNGLDTLYNLMKSLESNISSDYAPGKVMKRLVDEGNLGRKTGKGFYDWTPENKPIIDKNVKKAGLLNAELFFAIQLNEGCRLLEMGISPGYKMIDDIMMAGLNSPGPFGPGKRNYEKWSKMLEDLAEKTGKIYFKPCELMKTGKFIEMRK